MCNDCFNKDYYKWEIDLETGFRKLSYQTDFVKEFSKFDSWDGEFRVCAKCKRSLPKTTYFFAQGEKNGFHYYCKECEGTNFQWGRNAQKEFNRNGFHYCTKCDRVLPLNIIYFYPTVGRCNKTGFHSNCRECISKINDNFLIHTFSDYKDFLNIKEGYKVCTSCLIEYPNTGFYFFNKNDRENGMTICKKCKGNYFGIFQMNVVLKNELPDGFKYCNGCKKLITEEQYNKEYMCEDCAREKRKIYNQTPQAKIRLGKSRHKRLFQKKQLLSDLTEDEWIDTLLYFNNSCAYCGISEEEHKLKYNERLQQDHIIPVSKNGEYTKNNIIPACKSCNPSKNAKTLEEYVIYKGLSKEVYDKIINFVKINSKDNNLEEVI